MAAPDDTLITTLPGLHATLDVYADRLIIRKHGSAPNPGISFPGPQLTIHLPRLQGTRLYEGGFPVSGALHIHTLDASQKPLIFTFSAQYAPQAREVADMIESMLTGVRT